MRSALAAAGLVAAVLAAGLALSGGEATDPPVPRGFPGPVPAFMLEAAGRDGGLARVAARRDRRWLARARPLGPRAPRWARRMYRRSLLVLRASLGPNGAVVAGARPGWAYVWPRDAAAVAIALAAGGYRVEARRVVRFLGGLDLEAAARFRGTALAVPGRGAQGDAAGWVAAAARAVGLPAEAPLSSPPLNDTQWTESWQDRPDYQEKGRGDYLGNAIAATRPSELDPAPAWSTSDAPMKISVPRERERVVALSFVGAAGLTRQAGEPGSGLDSAAAWAVRPFALPALYPVARRTLLRLAAARESRYGLLPSEDWDGGADPWTAPTAWTAWALAALWRIDGRAGQPHMARVDRAAALALLGDLRRATTRRGLLPERVDAETGAPASTTPLVWSHAFAALALRELWP